MTKLLHLFFSIGFGGFLSGSEFELPFKVPDPYVSSPTGRGDEGSRLGEITSADREFKITYSVGGQFARRTKRPLSEDDSLDSMFYYHECEIDGVDVQVVGYRVQGEGGNFRIMVWVPELETHFSAYLTGRDQVKAALGDFEQFKLETTKREQAGTGQPATSPESDSEGNDKPQPEAEGRSR